MSDLKLGNTDILVLIGIFKVVPYIWFKSLNQYYNFDYHSLRANISYLKKSGYLSLEKDREGLEYLFLTKKGFEKVKGYIPLNYEWRKWGNQRTDTIHRVHHLIIFNFLIDYISEFRDENILGRKVKNPGDFEGYNIEEIYTDYEPDKCRFAFKYSGYEIDLRPDMILKPSKGDEQVVVCLEADTGQMGMAPVFNKIIRYGMLCHHELKSLGMQKVKLYFSFHSQKRAESMFKYPKELKRDGLMYELFNQGLVLKYKSNKSKAQILTLEFLKVLKEGKLEIYAGVERSGFENYKKVDFLGNLIEVCDKFGKYGILRSLE